tara:strand:- start:34340 stop:34834 length:495 start_codon:yes stop_codon:yes gene_type:complete
LNNISFIGMAGCGKSTLGKAVSKRNGLNFVDTDLLIEDKFKLSLEDIKIQNGFMFVRSEEEKAVLSLDSSSDIISTGGSAVYSEKSMMHLKKFSKIIYIKTPLEIIIDRIDLGQERGLAVPDGLSIAEVYSEREPLYDHHSQFKLDGSKPINDLVVLVHEILNG